MGGFLGVTLPEMKKCLRLPHFCFHRAPGVNEMLQPAEPAALVFVFSPANPFAQGRMPDTVVPFRRSMAIAFSSEVFNGSRGRSGTLHLSAFFAPATRELRTKENGAERRRFIILSEESSD
jgi:hypothetical protein